MTKDALPIVGEIACGTPITARHSVEGYIDTPDGVSADFALKCKGDSMTPTFMPGDLVLIRQNVDAETGQIAAVGVDGEATLKRIYRQGNQIVCVSDNHEYPPQIYAGENVTVYGIAVGFVRVW